MTELSRDGPLSEHGSELTRALEEYLAAVQEGKQPSRDAMLAKHPELAADLDACLASLDFICRAASPGQSADHTGPALQLLGEPLGDFRILREVGRGGMGVVHRDIKPS